MAAFPEEDLDRELTAQNIIFMRTTQNLTQEQLAQRAGVGIRSIYRAERAEPVMPKTLRKIAKGLKAVYSEMTTMRRFLNIKPPDQSFVFHEPENAIWFEPEPMDRRRHIPEENQTRIQQEMERHRLGSLGMVPWFRSGLGFVMPNGPSIAFYEVYGPHDAGNSTLFENWVLYCLRGEVMLTVEGAKRTLKQGGAVGFCTGTSFQIEPSNPLRPNELPPLLMYVGGVATGKLPGAKPKRKAK